MTLLKSIEGDCRGQIVLLLFHGSIGEKWLPRGSRGIVKRLLNTDGPTFEVEFPALGKSFPCQAQCLEVIEP